MAMITIDGREYPLADSEVSSFVTSVLEVKTTGKGQIVNLTSDDVEDVVHIEFIGPSTSVHLAVSPEVAQSLGV